MLPHWHLTSIGILMVNVLFSFNLEGLTDQSCNSGDKFASNYSFAMSTGNVYFCGHDEIVSVGQIRMQLCH